MRHFGPTSTLAVACILFSVSCRDAATAFPSDAPSPPSVEFGELYGAVQMSGLFSDQKTFADAIPDKPPSQIVADYEKQKQLPGFDLKAFIALHFATPKEHFEVYERRPNRSVRDYINDMWQVLRREPDEIEPYSSLLPLGRPYIVPGGRFREIYYWDSYFTMLGLEQDGQHALARDMLQNFASLIDRYGHVPNGNRSYYLSRSQPPFFSSMVELIAARDGDKLFVDYLPELRAEYDYWMEGAEKLVPGAAHRHALRLPDGALLNRYWDDRAAPRDESYREDIETAHRANRPAAEVYEDLRAGGESGWDFSSRWLADGKDLSTIRTTAIAPVDLNTLMLHLEETLAKAYQLKGDLEEAQRYRALADNRRATIGRLMWNAQAGFFVDYLWQEGRQSDSVSAATVFPLYFGVATPEQAHAIAAAVRGKLLEPSGLGTTLLDNGQQWDRPNGWAPMQYLAIEGLSKNGERDLAYEIADRWLHKNIQGYSHTGVLVEKYDVEQGPEQRGNGGGGGGEYELQLGFGWTNGVLAKLMAEFPFAGAAIALVNLPHSRSVVFSVAALLGGFMSTLYPVCVADAHDHMPADRVIAVSGRLILVSGLGSIIGPLIGTSVMARFSIDGLLYFMAAAALLLALVAIARRLVRAPPAHQGRTFEILTPQAAPLAHDLLGPAEVAAVVEAAAQKPG